MQSCESRPSRARLAARAGERASNNYFIMHDSIVKNLEKLKMPRSAAALPFS